MNAPVPAQNAEPPRVHPVKAANDALVSRQNDFAAALPAHIPIERFMRVVMTAIQRNSDLASADRASLFNSALMAAQDGLLPDGREGALVIYKTKVKRNGVEQWIAAVQWMPMVAGILKKVRNSGELSSIVARVVYAGDKFRSWIDDEGEHIEYEALPDADTNMIRCVFAMAKLKDGTIEVEVLRPADIEKIRNVSRAKDRGPWVDWWDEMAKKSAIRRLAKRLPISTDLDDVIRRDDALYDLDGASDKQVRIAGPQSLAAKLDSLSAPAPQPAPAGPPSHDAETGEIIDDNAAGDPPAQESAAAAQAQVDASPATAASPAAGARTAPAAIEQAAPAAQGDASAFGDAPNPYFEAGRKARARNMSRRAMPGELRADDRKADADAWLAGFDSGDVSAK